jgi:uncharacterized protein with von Willebrand factor type A (vWA) domain
MNTNAKTFQRPTLTRDVSRWADALYTTRLLECQPLQNAVKQIERALAVAAVKQHCTDRGELARIAALAEGIGAEVFASLYSDALDVVERPAPDTEFVDLIHDAINGRGALPTTCKGDPDMSALAAAKLLEAVAPFVTDMKLEANSDDDDDSEITVMDRARAILRQEVDEAAREVEEIVAALDELAPGLSACPALHEQNDTDRLRLAEWLADSEDIRKLMELVGRMRRVATADRKQETSNARSKCVGVEKGNDFSRVLPAEMVMFGMNDAMKALALAKFAERQLMQYRYVGEEKAGRGPVVVCIDESSSMHGMSSNGMTCHQYAAACAIAVLGMAQRESRDCSIVGFNGNVRWSYTVKADGSAVSNTTKGRSVASCADVAIAVITSVAMGGTDFGPVLSHALDLDCGIMNERSDLVLITDGYANLPEQVSKRLEESRENGLRLYGLTVGGGSMSAAVRTLAHSVVDIDTATPEEIAHALA